MQAYFEHFLWSAGGAFITVLVAYFLMAKGISNELSYLKGQLVMLLQRLSELAKLTDVVIGHTQDLTKAKMDMDYAHDKIRDMQRRMEGGK